MADNEVKVALPSPLENLQLPDPALVTYYDNAINHRCFWIDYDIDETLLELARNIIAINRQDNGVPVEQRKPIVIWVFSYGGDLDSTFSFLDICALSQTPIVTINAGISMSAGLLILLAGHKRYCLPRSQALIHTGSLSGLSGTYEQTEAYMNTYKKNVEVMQEFVLNHTRIDKKEFSKKKAKDWYLNAAEQIEKGVVDEILDDLSKVM